VTAIDAAQTNRVVDHSARKWASKVSQLGCEHDAVDAG
jgi:hypothetical protein